MLTYVHTYSHVCMYECIQSHTHTHIYIYICATPPHIYICMYKMNPELRS